MAWQRWWGVITVERLSCSLHTLPLSSLGQEHDAKKMKARERSKAAMELLLLKHYGGFKDGFGTVVASVTSSDVKLEKTHFLLLLLYSCSLNCFAITRTILGLNLRLYSYYKSGKAPSICFNFLNTWNAVVIVEWEKCFSKLSFDTMLCPLFHAFDFPLLKCKHTRNPFNCLLFNCSADTSTLIQRIFQNISK